MSYQLNPRICRPCVASGFIPDVKRNVARIRRPFVALEPVSNVKDNVAHPSAIGLHRAGKVRHSPSLQFPPSIGEGRLFNIPRFLFGKLYEPNEPYEPYEPYELLLPFNQSTNQLFDLSFPSHSTNRPFNYWTGSSLLAS